MLAWSSPRVRRTLLPPPPARDARRRLAARRDDRPRRVPRPLRRVSDGTGSIDDIAAAAARAGLQFVILTDHGDGTRVPGPPSYRSGVLCIEAVEVNTTGGHLVALGARPVTLSRWRARREAVLEDVHRLGGMGIAAHPESPRESLRWRDGTCPSTASSG